MTGRGEWVRVRRDRPCPVCERSDWCLLARDGTAAICARIESPKRAGAAGYLHKLTDNAAWPTSRTRSIPLSALPVRDFGTFRERCGAELTPDALARLADSLAVAVDALRRLGIGWSAEHRAFTLPMRGARGEVCGVRLRLPNGRKLSVRGGREGLFIPSGLPADGRLFVCEGPTDTAALLTLGPAAIGRPSCAGGAKLVCDLARGRPVAIVADADSPGRRGAAALASTLAAHCKSVRVITPPIGIKDAREWVRHGATAADVLRAVDGADPARLSVKATRRA